MPCKTGDYLGGIRTLEDLRIRCRIDPDTACWHWSLAVVQGAPKVHFVTPDTGKRIGARGRRAAYYLCHGHDLPPKHLAFGIKTCKSLDCVNPAHTTIGTRSAQGSQIRATGAARGNPRKTLASQITARSRSTTVLSVEAARHIRSCTEPNKVLAQRYAISPSAIAAVRAGKAWRDMLPGASVFAMF